MEPETSPLNEERQVIKRGSKDKDSMPMTSMTSEEVDRKEAESATRGQQSQMVYQVEDTPPVSSCIVLGLQYYLTMFPTTLSVPLILSSPLCMGADNLGKSELIGTMFTAAGITTLLQTLFGVRLPIIQGGTYSLVAPTLAYFSLPEWKCPTNIISAQKLASFNTSDLVNVSYITTGSAEHREVWQTRLREIQGSLMVASLFEILMGLSGLIGFLLRFIGPLSICPTVTLLGLSLIQSANKYAGGQYWIAISTAVFIIVLSQYLGNMKLPVPAFSREKRCHMQRLPLLKMLPIIIGILTTWVLCAILTVTGVFPDAQGDWGYKARTDTRISVLYEAPWVRVPYPGQWGMPTIGAGCVVGFLAGLMSSIMQSVGDYHACATLAGAPSPPTHAVNRGIAMEGFDSFLDAIFGTGNGCTSYPTCIGLIGVTKVASRSVVQVAALFMMVFGIFTKFGALFVTIPDPVIGGTIFFMLAMIVAVGLSNLNYVDLQSSRNIFIIGFSFIMGMSVSQWTTENQNAINTGSKVVDSMFLVLLKTSFFVGGSIGFILDNTIPGTEEERGIAYWKKVRETNDKCTDSVTAARVTKIYDMPKPLRFINRWRCTRYIPICPMFRRKQHEDTLELDPAL